MDGKGLVVIGRKCSFEDDVGKEDEEASNSHSKKAVLRERPKLP